MPRLLVVATAALALGCPGSAHPDAGAPDASLDASATDAAEAPPPDAEHDAGPPLGPHPSVDELSARMTLPELRQAFDGSRRVETVEDWQTWRRSELLDLFSFYLYGYAPSDEIVVRATRVLSIPDFTPGVTSYEEHELELVGLDLRVHVALFTPAGVSDAPVFIGPNRCGNQEITADPRVRATTAWIGDNCGASVEASRGVRASQWPIDAINRAGFALAAFHESEIDPDDDETSFENGVHGALRDDARDPRLRWGRISAWAWGVSRVVDFLAPSGLVDADRIAVVGHSRRGKTALLAGARDPRIAMVIAHQSGTGGAALTHVVEPGSETVAAINTLFPAWFDDVFPTFAGRETRLPIDQHMLIALSAPRLVLVTDGADDAWAEPTTALRSVELASDAWDLYSMPGVIEGAAGEHELTGRLAWRVRPGGHELTEADWTTFLAFARAHWP